MSSTHGFTNQYSRRKVFYLFVALFFLVIYFFKLAKDIKYGGVGYWSYFPSVFFLAVFTLRIRILWFAGFVYSLFALHYYFFITQMPYPSSYEFTLPIVELFFGDGTGYRTSNPISGLLLSISFFFYVFYVLIFASNRLYRLYAILKK